MEEIYASKAVVSRRRNWKSFGDYEWRLTTNCKW